MKKTAKNLVEVTVEINCDACGASVVPDLLKPHLENLDSFSEFGVLRASYGYGSSLDGENYNFDLCEVCFGKLVGTIEDLRAVHGLNK